MAMVKIQSRCSLEGVQLANTHCHRPVCTFAPWRIASFGGTPMHILGGSIFFLWCLSSNSKYPFITVSRFCEMAAYKKNKNHSGHFLSPWTVFLLLSCFICFSKWKGFFSSMQKAKPYCHWGSNVGLQSFVGFHFIVLSKSMFSCTIPHSLILGQKREWYTAFLLFISFQAY